MIVSSSKPDSDTAEYVHVGGGARNGTGNAISGIGGMLPQFDEHARLGYRQPIPLGGWATNRSTLGKASFLNLEGWRPALLGHRNTTISLTSLPYLRDNPIHS